MGATLSSTSSLAVAPLPQPPLQQPSVPAGTNASNLSSTRSRRANSNAAATRATNDSSSSLDAARRRTPGRTSLINLPDLGEHEEEEDNDHHLLDQQQQHFHHQHSEISFSRNLSSLSHHQKTTSINPTKSFQQDEEESTDVLGRNDIDPEYQEEEFDDGREEEYAGMEVEVEEDTSQLGRSSARRRHSSSNVYGTRSSDSSVGSGRQEESEVEKNDGNNDEEITDDDDLDMDLDDNTKLVVGDGAESDARSDASDNKQGTNLPSLTAPNLINSNSLASRGSSRRMGRLSRSKPSQSPSVDRSSSSNSGASDDEGQQSNSRAHHHPRRRQAAVLAAAAIRNDDDEEEEGEDDEEDRIVATIEGIEEEEEDAGLDEEMDSK